MHFHLYREFVLIRFDHVTKQYPNSEIPALSDVALTIEDGEFVFLVGSSGSGKSTMIRLLLKEEVASDGTIEVDSINVGEISSKDLPEFRRAMGVVFQDFRLLPNRTVYENIAFALEVIGADDEEIEQRVPAVLELVSLEGKEGRFPNELSGGEQQRVALARAVVNRPKLLLCDEPTGNLDPTTSLGIVKLLDRINRTGTTVVMATHDHAMVDEMRKRTIQLEQGRVIRDESSGTYQMAGQ
ncbi:MAG: cell division ATP-binding protein FtsE [Actinomycetota bacterium]